MLDAEYRWHTIDSVGARHIGEVRQHIVSNRTVIQEWPLPNLPNWYIDPKFALCAKIARLIDSPCHSRC